MGNPVKKSIPVPWQWPKPLHFLGVTQIDNRIYRSIVMPALNGGLQMISSITRRPLMADKKAQLIIEGAAPVELPVLSGTIGPDVVDVRSLTATGKFTFDPGFMSTASCESKITYIVGDKGILLHRGYPNEQLPEPSAYLEPAYLLRHGYLPNPEKNATLVNTSKNHPIVHDQLKSVLNGFRRDAHPMAVMCGIVGALSAFYHDSLDINAPQHRMISAHRLIAKMPTIAAMTYKYSIGQPIMYPRNDLNYAENFLHMMFNTPAEIKPISPVLAK